MFAILLLFLLLFLHSAGDSTLGLTQQQGQECQATGKGDQQPRGGKETGLTSHPDSPGLS